jgi:hypothetical protein
MPIGRLSVLCIFLLLYERVERKVYGFRVEIVKITEVAEMADVFRMIIRRTARHVLQPITECVRKIRMTTRHVIRMGSEMAEASSKTARHVMWSQGEVAV